MGISKGYKGFWVLPTMYLAIWVFCPYIQRSLDRLPWPPKVGSKYKHTTQNQIGWTCSLLGTSNQFCSYLHKTYYVTYHFKDFRNSLLNFGIWMMINDVRTPTWIIFITYFHARTSSTFLHIFKTDYVRLFLEDFPIEIIFW